MSAIERGAKRADLSERETPEARARNLLRTQLPSLRSRDQALDELYVTYINGPPRITQIAAALYVLGARGFTVNLNDRVRFRLTSEGYDVWRHYLDTVKGVPVSLQGSPDRTLTAKLWEVMGVFGAALHASATQLIVDNEFEVVGEESR